MKHIGLFEGIGGFSLAAEWMGWETIAWCEWNEFCQKVLSYHFPNAKQHGDITKTDFTIYRGQCDILTGGFPCQPYSQAGKRLGKEDDRHLWPEMLRAIREIQPGYVVGENVRGLTNWNGGLVFDEVQADLEAEGYEVLPFLLPACAVNAPHRRDRIWFIAYSNGCGNNRMFRTEKSDNEGEQSENTIKSGNGRAGEIERYGKSWVATNTHNKRFAGKEYRTTEPGFNSKHCEGNDWHNFPTQSPVRSRNDGLSSELAGITFSKHRNESIKAYGNAIVPQVALQIFKAIALLNKKTNI